MILPVCIIPLPSTFVQTIVASSEKLKDYISFDISLFDYIKRLNVVYKMTIVNKFLRN